MDNLNNEEDVDLHTVVRGYKILIDKYNESYDFYKKIIAEKEKTIDLLKEKISIMEEIDKVKDERIEILTKKLIGKETKDGVSSESS